MKSVIVCYLCQAYIYIDSDRKYEICFQKKKLFFLHTIATCSELPSNISTMSHTFKSTKMLIYLEDKCVYSFAPDINKDRMYIGQRRKELTNLREKQIRE